ncbi:hypothetical protein H5410_039605 [Solanum commersonii]|uniref:Uncharacterized protein n=1 Tax=Solanum commersonii TaxID=4109 RepID=A0A9J5XLE8_SOLCO|nr:hypothetical protein H5410_039605 [Solanum commersonii]
MTTHKAHCLILPYPGQGYINPMLQFAKRLQSKRVIDWMSKIYPIKTIGPTIPSIYLDKRLHDDKEYGLSIFKSMTNECLNWLNHQPISSVVYVSFGSLAKLEGDQMEELAWGLKNSNNNF